MSELEPTRTYSNPTATDELRRMLDDRGVEWSDDGYPTTCTVWVVDDVTWRGLWRDGHIELIAHVTPEQAVEATLGRGTCHVAAFGFCSECGARTDGIYQHYCPNCGRQVVE